MFCLGIPNAIDYRGKSHNRAHAFFTAVYRLERKNKGSQLHFFINYIPMLFFKDMLACP
jgi:hypothetical protein